MFLQICGEVFFKLQYGRTFKEKVSKFEVPIVHQFRVILFQVCEIELIEFQEQT